MFDQSVAWLWEYGLKYNYVNLVYMIINRFPNIGLKVGLKERECLTVKFLLLLLKQHGCTAEMSSPEFLTSFESAVVAFISSHPRYLINLAQFSNLQNFFCSVLFVRNYLHNSI